MYPTKHANNIGPTWCTLQEGGIPLQLAAKRSRIHLEYNIQIGYFIFQCDMNLTIYSSELPTSLHYHLPLLLQTTKSWMHKHVTQVTAQLNRDDRWALHPICGWLAHSKNSDTSYSTATLPNQPPNIWPRMYMWKVSVRPEAPRISSSMHLDESILIPWWTAVNEHLNVQWVYIESYGTNLSLPVMGNLDGQQRHLSALAMISNIMMLVGLGFLQSNFVISIFESGPNRH